MKTKIKHGFSFPAALLVTMLFTQNAGATLIPVWDSQVGHSETTFAALGSGYATVESYVYKYDIPNEYVYSYQITNHSSVELSFFSVDIQPGGDAWSADYDGVDIVFYSTAQSPAQVESVNYMFASTIGDTEVSSILWFKSSYGPSSTPVTGAGALMGRDGIATGSLLTPVPEPAAIVLFGTGWLVSVVRKKKPRIGNGIEINVS